MLVKVGEIIGQDSTATVSAHTEETGAEMSMLFSILMERFAHAERAASLERVLRSVSLLRSPA